MDKHNVAICIKEYYAAMKRNGTALHATTWVNLVNITLSETCEAQGPHMACSHPGEVPRIGKFIETERKNSMTGTRAGRWQGGADASWRWEFLFDVMKAF